MQLQLLLLLRRVRRDAIEGAFDRLASERSVEDAAEEVVVEVSEAGHRARSSYER